MLSTLLKFDSNPPALRCFLCFQGCYDCSSFASSDSLSASPIGTVWLCRSCHILNNPVKQKRSKGTISTSNAASNAPTESNIPVQNSEIKVTTATVNKLTPNKSPDICEKFKIGKCPHGISGKTLHEGLLAINLIQNGATVSRETVNEVNTAAGKETTVSIITRNIVPLRFRTKHVLLKNARSFILWHKETETSKRTVIQTI